LRLWITPEKSGFRKLTFSTARYRKSRSILEVTLDAEALREAGRFELVVKNPEPLDPFYVRGMWGNGTSNVAHLIVNYKY